MEKPRFKSQKNRKRKLRNNDGYLMEKFNPQKYFDQYPIWSEDKDVPNSFRNVLNDVVIIDTKNNKVRIYEGRSSAGHIAYMRLPNSQKEFDKWITNAFIKKSF